ncbi:potassium channel family protein [Alkalicoccus luteus]|uniref:Potassium channel family protein n=1 Tax=Alkalicoccus luteus TaxID=1237094 RepID=A0A969PL73_9BACI|nr:potassium channel family protein [Alkalicoccus luteus]NJP36207.1 potassium channel family protein [Alkalicoccus luteus]
MKQKLKIAYEVILVLLILWSASTVFYESNLVFLDHLVWIVLLTDVLVRLFRADNKAAFIKRNPFDFIAAIPLDSIFQFARLIRLFRLIRVALLLKRTPIYTILRTNGLMKTLGAVGILIFLSAIPVTYLEPGVETFMDGVWRSVVTATTVGYGDIAPVTTTGRGIAVLLMVFGIGLIGMVTSSIATYFLDKKEDLVDNDTVQFIQSQLKQYDTLSPYEYDRLIYMLNSLKEEQTAEKKEQ